MTTIGHGHISKPTENGVRGRVALVTGGARAIGQAMSCRLAAQGAHVAVGERIG